MTFDKVPSFSCSSSLFLLIIVIVSVQEDFHLYEEVVEACILHFMLLQQTDGCSTVVLKVKAAPKLRARHPPLKEAAARCNSKIFG